jgi:hypothetical protein
MLRSMIRNVLRNMHLNVYYNREQEYVIIVIYHVM